MVLLYVFIHLHNVNCKSELYGYLEKCYYIMGVIVIETSFNLVFHKWTSFTWLHLVMVVHLMLEPLNATAPAASKNDSWLTLKVVKSD